MKKRTIKYIVSWFTPALENGEIINKRSFIIIDKLKDAVKYYDDRKNNNILESVYLSKIIDSTDY